MAISMRTLMQALVFFLCVLGCGCGGGGSSSGAGGSSAAGALGAVDDGFTGQRVIAFGDTKTTGEIAGTTGWCSQIESQAAAGTYAGTPVRCYTRGTGGEPTTQKLLELFRANVGAGLKIGEGDFVVISPGNYELLRFSYSTSSTMDPLEAMIREGLDAGAFVEIEPTYSHLRYDNWDYAYVLDDGRHIPRLEGEIEAMASRWGLESPRYFYGEEPIVDSSFFSGDYSPFFFQTGEFGPDGTSERFAPRQLALTEWGAEIIADEILSVVRDLQARGVLARYYDPVE